MSTHQTGSQAQVEREQNIVKNVAQDAVDGARRIKEEGISAPSVPTTQGAVHALDKQERVVNSLEHSGRGQQMGGKGQQVMEDIKRVIQDEKTIVHKNDGDLIQNIVQNTISFLHDMSGDNSMQGVFSTWQNLANSLFNSGNMSDVLSSGSQIFRSLKDTEEFLHLASEMLSMLKLLVAEGQERLTENRAANLAEIKIQKDRQRQEIIADIVDLLRTLGTNEIWRSMMARAENASHRVKGVAGETKDAAGETINRVIDSQTTTQIINDIRTLLQRLVGEQMNVDAFFNALAKVLLEFSENQRLADVIYETRGELHKVSENPLTLDDPENARKLEDLSRRAQLAVDELMNSTAFNNLRMESHNLSEAIKSEPSNARLLMDTRKLWNDIKSDKEGQLFDPALLSGVRSMIIPMFLDHLSNVPVPPIYDSGDMLGKYDYSLTNIKLSLPEMLPENIHLRFDHEMDANLTNLSATNQRTFVFLEVRDIQIHLRDVNWSYHRHRLPRFSDAGKADVDTEGSGVILRLKMELRNDFANKHLVSILDSRVIIDKFSIRFSDSKHDKMYKMLTNLFATRIKREVERAIEGKMHDFGEMLNGQVATMLGEARVKSHSYHELAQQKIGQAREAAHDLKSRAEETKDRAAESADALKERARIAASDKSEQAKGIIRDQARQATGEDPEAVIGEAKQEVKAHARGAITIAAERAIGFLDDQQAKIEEQRQDKHLVKETEVYVQDPSHWHQNPVAKDPHHSSSVEMGSMPSANLSKDLPTANLNKGPAQSESADEKLRREMEELRVMKQSQQAGSSEVPLAGLGGRNETTSADIAYQLHPQISSFGATEAKDESKPIQTQAKQGL